MTAELDALLEGQPVAPASLTGAVGRPAKCRRHPEWVRDYPVPNGGLVTCIRCGTVKDEARSRRGAAIAAAMWAKP